MSKLLKASFILAFIIFLIPTVTAPTANPLAGLVAQDCDAMVAEASDNSYVDACDGTYPAACPTDLIDCNDGSFENAGAASPNWGGTRLNYSNTSITNCNSITKVELCYEYWNTQSNIGSCGIFVDANGSASYTQINSTCPGTTADPGFGPCHDVTSSESWGCPNFFGATGNKAIVRTRHQRTASGPASSERIDVMYFNVTYTTGASVISFTVTLPGQSAVNANGTVNITADIVFNVTKNNQYAIQPCVVNNDCQTATIPIFQIDNTGNTALNMWLYLNQSMNANFTLYANKTTGIIQNLSITPWNFNTSFTAGGTDKIWLYLNATNMTVNAKNLTRFLDINTTTTG